MPTRDLLALRTPQCRRARRSRAIDVLNNAICFLLGTATAGMLFHQALSHHAPTHSGTQRYTAKPLLR